MYLESEKMSPKNSMKILKYNGSEQALARHCR